MCGLLACHEIVAREPHARPYVNGDTPRGRRRADGNEVAVGQIARQLFERRSRVDALRGACERRRIDVGGVNHAGPAARGK